MRGVFARSLCRSFIFRAEKIEKNDGRIFFGEHERIRERRRSRRRIPVMHDERFFDFQPCGNVQQIRAAVRVGAMKRGNFFRANAAARNEKIRFRYAARFRRKIAHRRKNNTACGKRGIERCGDERVVRKHERSRRIGNGAGTRDERRRRFRRDFSRQRKIAEVQLRERSEAPFLHAPIRHRKHLEIRPRAFATFGECVVPAAFASGGAESVFVEHALCSRRIHVFVCVVFLKKKDFVARKKSANQGLPPRRTAASPFTISQERKPSPVEGNEARKRSRAASSVNSIPMSARPTRSPV